VDGAGLHLSGDELLVKAREAMLQAVQGFNNPRAYFKSEVFIVTAVIAWTYLMHAHFKRLGVDFRYRDRRTGEFLRHGTARTSTGNWSSALEMRTVRSMLPQRRTLSF
jgi:Domain of unknown function (DUF3644)